MGKEEREEWDAHRKYGKRIDGRTALLTKIKEGKNKM
jgi:hypothetical protein